VIRFRGFRLAILCAAAAAVLAATDARAHPLDESRSEIAVAGSTVSWRLSVHPAFLARLDADGDGAIAPAEMEAGAPALQRFFAERLFVNADGRLCRPALPAVQSGPGLPRANLFVEYRCPAPVQRLRIEMHLFDGVSPNWVSLARLAWGPAVREFAFREGNAAWDVGGVKPARPALAAQIGSFLALGVEHIFTGYDHLLFLIGLLLLGGRFWALFKIVTAFTLAHSVTLILAALGVVDLPARVVEPAIALSIAYVGAENFFLKSVDRRWVIALVFGLIHGFGFASILREMGLPKEGLVLSLLAFNVGVEAGQLAVVAVALPVILLVRKQPWHRWAVSTASIAIVGMGLYWFVTRVGG
jgi:hydrogenase/urease accessory protein HupE